MKSLQTDSVPALVSPSQSATESHSNCLRDRGRSYQRGVEDQLESQAISPCRAFGNCLYRVGTPMRKSSIAVLSPRLLRSNGLRRFEKPRSTCHTLNPGGRPIDSCFPLDQCSKVVSKGRPDMARKPNAKPWHHASSGSLVRIG